MNDPMMSEQDIEQLARRSLDESVDGLDAATLSRLNQARQRALEANAKAPLLRNWLPVGAAGFAVLALAIALPVLTPKPQQPGTELPGMAESAYPVSEQDSELIEDLDLILWLADAEDHAS